MALYAFDGTWNLRDGKDVLDEAVGPPSPGRSTPRRETIETNVHRFAEFYDDGRLVVYPDGRKRPNHEHLQGVGTRFGALGRVFGGAFGFGGRFRIRRMFRQLALRYHHGSGRDDEGRWVGDRIVDVVGFSRGAALAVHFVNLIDRYEIPDPVDGRRHRFLWWYEGLGLTFRHPKLRRREKPDGVRAEADAVVRFLGLFDTVATFGFPLAPVRNVSRFWDVWTIPDTVGRAFHAMALDERRKTFELVRPTMASEPMPTDDDVADALRTRLYEVWFRGAHANVGGGYTDRGLSDIALAWMMEQARWTWERRGAAEPAGFAEARTSIEPHASRDPVWPGTRREVLVPAPGGLLGRPRKARRRTPWRHVEDSAWVHHSVLLRSANLVADYYNVNRPLLRGLPPDAQFVYDSPHLFGGTTRELARDLAREAFRRIPVFPARWCTIDASADDAFIYRSDHWIAQGPLQRTATVTRVLPKADVDLVAEAWFESSGTILDERGLAAALAERDRSEDVAPIFGFAGFRPGDPATSGEIVEWAMAVLAMMWPYLPRGGDAEVLLRPLEQRRRETRRPGVIGGALGSTGDPPKGEGR